MRHKRLELIIILLLGFSLTGLQAQESVPTAGGNASGNGGSATYTVGQVVYTTNTGTNGSVAQGVQQLFEISEVTGLEAAKGISLSVAAYPNPTADYISLKIENFDIENLSYQLYGMNGVLLLSKTITNDHTDIPMSAFSASTYFVKIIHNKKEVKSFKIIKK